MEQQTMNWTKVEEWISRQVLFTSEPRAVALADAYLQGAMLEEKWPGWIKTRAYPFGRPRGIDGRRLTAVICGERQDSVVFFCTLSIDPDIAGDDGYIREIVTNAIVRLKEFTNCECAQGQRCAKHAIYQGKEVITMNHYERLAALFESLRTNHYSREELNAIADEGEACLEGLTQQQAIQELKLADETGNADTVNVTGEIGSSAAGDSVQSALDPTQQSAEPEAG